MKESVVLSLSGGLDSSTLLLRCLKEYKNVIAVSFDYGQKHSVELERAQQLVDYLCNKDVSIRNSLRYRVIHLNGLSELLNSALITGGEEVPEGHYAEGNMRSTVVPNRNKIFSSIVQSIALSTANQTGKPCDIALGIHAGDHAIYPDCRQEFRDIDDAAFRAGNWDAEYVNYFTPYLEGDKFTILQEGEMLCKELGLDFDEVYSRTNTSYKPILIEAPVYDNNLNIVAAPRWYSDYKSASSVERVEAFIKLGRKDPVGYADENGVVDWETVVSYVNQVLTEYNNK
jgi:7-cyano-7-deazaguanine synthase